MSAPCRKSVMLLVRKKIIGTGTIGTGLNQSMGYHTVNVYVVIHFVIACGLFEWQRICIEFFGCLFISVLSLKIQLIKEGKCFVES
jgi:hypothetical protein